MTSTAITVSKPATIQNSLAWSARQPGTLREGIGAMFSNLTTATALATVLGHAIMVAHVPTADAPDFGRRGAIQSEASRADLQLITRIREFGNYPNGWDGFDGVPPTQKAIREAVDFVKSITHMGATIWPLATAAGDGEILLLWKDRPFYLSISFSGDGTYSYYADYVEDQKRRELFADDVAVGEALPVEIRRLLS